MKNIFSLFGHRASSTQGNEGASPLVGTSEELEKPLTRGDVVRVAEMWFAEQKRAERVRARRNVAKWAVAMLILALGVMFVLGSSGPSSDQEVEVGQKSLLAVPLTGKKDTAHVAFIPIEGDIDGDEFGRPGFDNTTLYIRTALSLAGAQENISAVIFYINSYGGGAVASAQGHRLIKEFREASKVPVYAYVSSHAYSGGYYLALGAEKIYADPAAAVGSVGVIMSYFNTAEIGQLLGIGDIEIATGSKKACIGQWKKLSLACRAMLERSVGNSFKQFVRAMADSRHLSFDDLYAESKRDDGRTNGAIFSAEDAVANKMIDGTMTTTEFFKHVSAEVAKKNPDFKKVEFVRYDKKLGLLAEWNRDGRKALQSVARFMNALSGKYEERMELRAE